MVRLGLSLIFLALSPSALLADGLRICVDGEYDGRLIEIPAGTVFAYGGPMMGSNLRDVKDNAHQADGLKGGWKNLPPDEVEDRNKRMAADMNDKTHQGLAAVILKPVRLTSAAPCAQVGAGVARSKQWRWAADQIFEDPKTYFQAYGVIGGTELITGFDDDKKAFDFFFTRGEINAQVIGTISRQIMIPEDNQ